MLSKTERLSRQDFTRFFASGSRTHSSFLTLIYTPATTLRAAVVVSKKVAKKAHERNTIRRRLYAAIERFRIEQGLKGVVIVVAKPAVAGLPRLKQRAELTSLLSRLPKGG